jgi:hypothetical protein
VTSLHLILLLRTLINSLVLQSLRPKLSEEQRKQLEECFELMDADGSGAIDADELGAAFKVSASSDILYAAQEQQQQQHMCLICSSNPPEGTAAPQNLVPVLAGDAVVGHCTLSADHAMASAAAGWQLVT